MRVPSAGEEHASRRWGGAQNPRGGNKRVYALGNLSHRAFSQGQVVQACQASGAIQQTSGVKRRARVSKSLNMHLHARIHLSYSTHTACCKPRCRPMTAAAHNTQHAHHRARSTHSMHTQHAAQTRNTHTCCALRALQAQDRCHRIGQTREVHIYRLVSEVRAPKPTRACLHALFLTP